MQQFLSVWIALDGKKRLVVMLSSVAMFAAVIGLARLATAPNMVTLFSGLDNSAAGEVIKVLEQKGTVFEVRGGAIYVDSQERDQLRMDMASQGLPASGNQGYELLDGISGFGTTAQMFDAAYWRAKEGELARTIVASPQFFSARVHISNTPSRAFRKPQSQGASVTVTGAGSGISPAQAKALRFLVSSAVAGMSTSDVSVIDGRSGIVVADETQALGVADSADTETKLRNNVLRLLEARVGVGNAVVEVNIETNSETESITERVFDPDSRVAISVTKEERTSNADGTSGGSVTVASNLPEGDAAGSGNQNSSQNSETSETTNYEVSETMREVVRGAGSVQRISIAAMVDGVYETDAATNETKWTARSDAELAALRELVSSAVGYDESRGDTIVLKTLQFQVPELPSPGIEASLLNSLNLDPMRIVQVTVLALVSVVLGLFVLRPALASGSVPALANSADISRLASPNSAAATPPVRSPGEQVAALTGEIDVGEPLLENLPVLDNKDPLGSNGVDGQTSDNATDRLRELVADRGDETVEILRSWIDTERESA